MERADNVGRIPARPTKTAEVARDLRLERCLKRILNPAPTPTSMPRSQVRVNRIVEPHRFRLSLDSRRASPRPGSGAPRLAGLAAKPGHVTHERGGPAGAHARLPRQPLR